ncbi:hypothetical protein AMS68_001314 [Peltaster fructicola]|uniref:TMEM205-like domain-containing protein n=1 Tax=Peltaster fructicola TaxID=286661 RepID=A0A6H0XM17_9PEZI|nr:hypothetical protein AMS68_001314 [Peltaster fructicola]
MPSIASLTDPKAYHILTYGTLLGTTFFQSFIAGPVAFKAIPRSAFAQLQTHVTPVFFAIQSVLPVLMALTWPGNKLASVGSTGIRHNTGILGLLQNENLWEGAVPIVIMLGTALVNLIYFGPATTRTMRERKHQETRDGKKSTDAGPHSAEMQRLNKKFGALHGASAAIDLVGFIAMIVYGMDLSERL